MLLSATGLLPVVPGQLQVVDNGDQFIRVPFIRGVAGFGQAMRPRAIIRVVEVE